MARDNTYDLIITDIRMPKVDGLDLFRELHSEYPDTPIIIISAHGDIKTAVDIIKDGAYDFLEKPINLNRLLLSVRNATDKNILIQETKTLKKKVEKHYEMIGESAPIKKLRQLIEKISDSDPRVLITGENGTGKEVLARAIYQTSPRNKRPFIEVNCAAIPSELIESELFGHEKGAFTSAIKNRVGKFEQANKGTIFLDEIGDMSLSAQAKVLRCLQENAITPVGSDKLRKIDVRVIAVTNKDLKIEIAKGNFREDLYHRLNVVPLHIPPLSDRIEDIPLLINHFNSVICDHHGRNIKRFTPEAISALQKERWPGNIRELRNIVERLIILCGNTIDENDVKEYV